MSSYRSTQLQTFYEKAKCAPQDTDQVLALPKDDKLADKFRALGNKFFFNGLFGSAIDEYNKSLCFAQLDGDRFSLSVAYASRADALFRMDLPRECIRSATLAEQANYPEHLRPRLTLMMSRCQDRIKFSIQQRPRHSLSLTYPSHEKIPFIANCLRMHTNDEFGRHIVTSQDLKVGDVVMVESPFVVCLRPAMRYKRCSHCMSGDHRHALIPCPTCTNAMYCSETCMKEASIIYHHFECGMSEWLNSQDEFIAMALRNFLVGVSIYGGVGALKQYLQDNESTAADAFSIDHTANNRQLEFLVLHRMHFMDSHMCLADRNYWMKKVADLTHLLVSHNVLEKDLDQPLVLFVLDTLYRYTIGSILNCYETSQMLPPRYEKELVTVSQQLVMAMASHSCAPNVQRVQQGLSQAMVVVRPIAKGGQLLDNYGMFHSVTRKKDRQLHLYNQYGFKCGCEACLCNYPLAKKLKHKKEVPNVYSLVELLVQTPSQIPSVITKLNQLDKLCEYLQTYDQHYPCAQLYEADAELNEIYTSLVEEETWESRFKDFYSAKN